MSNFIDFEKQVGNIRLRLAHEIESLFKELNRVEVLNCADEWLGITTSEGTQNVASIGYDIEGGVYVKTESGEVHDYMDLDTDDMVAIYENVWYQLKEK